MKTINTLDQIKFNVNGKTYEAELRRETGKDSNKKMRSFVWGPGDDRDPSTEFQALADHVGSDSVYTVTGEFPALDKAFRKMNKEIVAAKREVLDAAIEALDLMIPADQIKFSRKAGCQCGCSPGFLIGGRYGKTLYVNEVKVDAEAVAKQMYNALMVVSQDDKLRSYLEVADPQALKQINAATAAYRAEQVEELEAA